MREVYDIQTITQLLSDNPRNQLLWIMGTNNGLRADDLVRLKVDKVEGVKVGDPIHIIENKTQKENILVLNKMTHKALTRYLNKVEPDSDSYLFSSRKGNGHISSQTVGMVLGDQLKRAIWSTHIAQDLGLSSTGNVWCWI